jgi:dTDP-4-amino-4,6-dideoxygalactose transaminase
MNIPFNIPYLTQKENEYIQQVLQSRKLAGIGPFTQKCQTFFEKRYGISKALLTNSCTDALELCATLIDIEAGDEVIVPSYTFVSTATAFALRGAKIVFCDSRKDHPGMDEDHLEELISNKTKAIVPVHYAGVACNMEKIMQVAKKHQLLVIEDASHAIDSFFTFSDGSRKALGTIGDLGTFSFHATKNISSGQGGLLAINNRLLVERAEIVWQNGTNRASFLKGNVDKYSWQDLGSSYYPAEIIAAFLWAQLEDLEYIQQTRIAQWEYYHQELQHSLVRPPYIPSYATNNGHIYYLLAPSLEARNALIEQLAELGISSAFHYSPLHCSDYYKKKYNSSPLVQAERYGKQLLRLPIFVELNSKQQDFICSSINEICLRQAGQEIN